MILFLPFILHCDNAEDVFPDIFGFSSEPFVLLTVVRKKKKKYTSTFNHTDTRQKRDLAAIYFPTNRINVQIKLAVRKMYSN